MLLAVAAMLVAIAIALAWRSSWAPAVGALVGVAVALAVGIATPDDLERAGRDLWRPMIVIVGIMLTASCASELGVFARLAAVVEPYTRGPVKRAFRVVFALSAVTAALLSNDAAILMVTPVVIELLRAVYPKRNPKFVVPFAFAAFVAAGVAPLPTGNPMNLVVAEKAGIDFNRYALHMIPVAIVGWLVAYAALARWFRTALSDEAPALGEAPALQPLGAPARVVMVVAAAMVGSYPLMAALESPLWAVVAPCALICTLAARAGGVAAPRVAAGVSWELVPFVFGVLVLANALAHAGLTDELARLYARSPAPLATIGVVAAGGSAVLNNHPMALLHSIALAGAPDSHVFAALIGGDLGPRLLPIGSLAGLLWMHQLRRQGVVVALGTFVRVGLVVTLPSLVLSLVTLWLLT